MTLTSGSRLLRKASDIDQDRTSDRIDFDGIMTATHYCEKSRCPSISLLLRESHVRLCAANTWILLFPVAHASSLQYTQIDKPPNRRICNSTSWLSIDIPYTCSLIWLLLLRASPSHQQSVTSHHPNRAAFPWPSNTSSVQCSIRN